MNQENQLPRDADGLVGLEAWSRSFDRLYRKTDRLYYDMAHTCGLSESAYWVMYAIYASGGTATVRSLVEECVASKQTINSALRKLETDGHILLRMADGKRKIVCLTESGKIYAARTAGRLLAAENEIYGAWPKEELEAYLRLTEKYLKELREKAKQLGKDAL